MSSLMQGVLTFQQTKYLAHRSINDHFKKSVSYGCHVIDGLFLGHVTAYGQETISKMIMSSLM